jgi:hypothetical protein
MGASMVPAVVLGVPYTTPKYSRRAVLAFIWACKSWWAQSVLATTIAPVVSLSNR